MSLPHDIKPRCKYCGYAIRSKEKICTHCVASGLLVRCASCEEYTYTGHIAAYPADENSTVRLCMKCSKDKTVRCPTCGGQYYKTLYNTAHRCHKLLNTAPHGDGQVTESTFDANPFRRSLGIELELCVPWGRGLRSKSRHYTTKSEHGGRVTEIVTNPARGDSFVAILHDLKRLLRTAPRPNLLGDRRESCGLHVHVDAKDFDIHALKNIVAITYAWEDELFDICSGIKDRAASQFCVPIGAHDHLPQMLMSANVHQFFKWWRFGRNIDDSHEPVYRYWNVNLDAWLRFKTIEFRAHEATDDMDRVLSWSLLCAAILDLAKMSGEKPYTHFLEMSDRLQISDLIAVEGERILGLNGDFFATDEDVLPPVSTFEPQTVQLETA